MDIKTIIIIVLVSVSSYLFGVTRNIQTQEVQTIHDTIYVEKQKPKVKAVPKRSKKQKVKTVKHKYKVSDTCHNFIKNEEKCKLTAYWDTNGYSIGYGHHSSEVTKDMKITKEKANELFEKDIKWVNEAINRILVDIDYKFPQHFIDGLGSLIFNCGEGGVRKSEFYSRLQKCRIKDGVINEKDYNFTLAAVKTARISCEAHKGRRIREYNLMKNGKN